MAAYYLELLKRLREAVHKKRPELWPINWILQHNSAPAHKALFCQVFSGPKPITEVEHPPSSSDLALNDLWLFPEDIQENVMTALKAFPQQEFQKCF
jgi:hypothetical protein